MLLQNYQFVNLKLIREEYEITDEEMKALVASTGQIPKLKIICLGNKITDEEVKALAGAAGNFPNLTEIYLYNNQIADEGVKTLQETSPI